MWLIIGALSAALLGTILYFSFRDYGRERRLKDFLKTVQAKDYKTAYTFWGCTAETPCRDYPYDKFLEDWGPTGTNVRQASGSIVEAERCGSGYLANVGRANDEVTLWVERETDVVSYAPWHDCPEKKLRLMKWLRMKFGNG